jgi:WD40 repeat protein
MKRIHLLLSLLILITITGLVFSQNTDDTPIPPETTEEPQVAFEIVGEIGRALPRKIVYDPQRERMAVVDAYRRLLLINAKDYSTLAVLHDRGEYGDVAFSNDGRWLAVTFGTSMELWNTETQTLAASLTNLGRVKQLLGPLAFSSNDEILIFYGIYPAPRALRVTENDTIVYPWVWHLPAARKEKPSTLPGEVEAVQMFDYANGFVLSPDDKIVAALPSRLRVLDAFTLETEYEIATDRYEQDPLSVWTSLRDDSVYVRPVTTDTLLQVDTEKGVLVEIPMNRELTRNDLDQIDGLELGSVAKVIGEKGDRGRNPLLEVLLGYYYRDQGYYGSAALTVTLVDLVLPPAASQDNVLALLFVFNEDTRKGTFRFSTYGGANQMVLSPDGEDLLIRYRTDDEYVFTYNITSGREVNRFLPALRSIGSYRRDAQNRVLAYDLSGEEIISDFQRIDADTNAILAEDLRYSRSFDRFYFSNDSTKVITLAGTEWRQWDIATGEVVRREAIYLAGSIIATSSDGSRFLSQFYDDSGGGGAEVLDLNTGENYTVRFNSIPGSSVEQMYANADWTKFLVVYSVNPFGQYAPGNQIAMYDYQEGLQWVIAGDDLPPNNQRLYGWVDEDTIYVYGQGFSSDIVQRVYGAEYAENSLPQCIVDAYPENIPQFSQLWERMVYRLRGDKLNEWTLRICADLPDSAAGVAAMLKPTDTPVFVAATGIPSGEVPQCLLDRYPTQQAEYSEVWKAMVVNATQEQAEELAVLLCEGIGVIYPDGEFDPSLGLTMFIDAETGERSSGDYQEPVTEERPMYPVYELFEKTEKRSLGTAILSPDKNLIAASSLPGELIVYRMIVTYDTLMAELTATSVAQLATANLIKAEASPSPTYNIIGTPRPTLTPTTELTLLPPPDDPVFSAENEVETFCPSESLYSIQNPPSAYKPDGRLYAPVLGDSLWVIEPENGTRFEEPEIPQCGRGLNCQFSPDKQWILAQTYELIYVTRPDNSDQRILWDLRTPTHLTPVPYDLRWSGNQNLEWEAPIPMTPEGGGDLYYRDGYVRDTLNVFPDPKPWFPEITINELPAQFISRQPGGAWAVASTSYNTGIGTGYKYYLYNTETGDYQMFAQYEYNSINVYWHPFGDRLYYTFPYENSPTYQVTFPAAANQLLGMSQGGTWSNDGRYRVYATSSRAYPIGVWDSQTGVTRAYCLPETGARLYDGAFTWSPDSGYVALQAFLPKDESVEGVGQHTMILNLETGEVVDLTTGAGPIVVWAQEPGTYGDGRVVTPTPTITATP